MKPMHLINSRCHYCSWCELLPPRFAVDQGYTAILVCSPIHSSSSLGGRKIDGNINGNMNESNLQAPAASFWCMYTLKKGELEVTEDRREICHCFLRVGSPVVHLVIKPKQFYQTYVLHVPMYSNLHLSPEQRISQIMVKTRLLFLLWGVNGIRKTVKEMGFLVMKKWKEAKKVKFW